MRRQEKKVYALTFGPLDSGEVKIAKRVAKVAGVRFLHSHITSQLIIENAEEVCLTDGMGNIRISFTSPYVNQLRILWMWFLVGMQFLVHESGRSNNAHKILYLATFELFLRQFMNF